MMNTMKKYHFLFAEILSLLLLALPLSPVFAQTTGDTSPTTDIRVPIDTTTAQETIPADTLIQTQESLVLSDVASSTQETIPADTLVQTQDPNTLLGDTASSTIPFDTGVASSTPDTVPIILVATTTIATDTAPITDQAASTDAVPLVPDTQTQDITPPEEQVVATMPVEAIAPKSEFKFAIGSARIATDKVPEWQKKGEDGAKKNKNKNQQVDTTVTNAPVIALDSASGAPVVSGSCTNVYYVILLYKNETDYSSDPASYILNKAYPCVGGQYSYTMNDVPQSIPSGTYYLLVGGMGERGSWTPVTSLVPIDITR